MPIKAKLFDDSELVVVDVPFHEHILCKVRAHARERGPTAVALVEALNDNHAYTYAQVDTLTDRFSAALYARLHIRYGDVVLIALPTCVDAPIVSLGTLSVGAVVSTINPQYTYGGCHSHSH
jgi:4-coumarate--CoA ligase